MQHRKVIFVHIPKTGGTSLLHVISRQYSGDRLYKFEAERVDEFHAMSQNARKRIACVMGHLHYGAHKHLPGDDWQYFTMLRNPVDRVISQYHWVRNLPTHNSYDRVKEMTLEEFAQNTRAGEQQLFILTGGRDYFDPDFKHDKRRLDENDLERGKQILDSFISVGLTEHFDESLIMYRHALGWNNISYIKRNKTKKQNKQSVTEQQRAIIRENSQLDIALYEHAQALFEQQRQAIGSSFERELKRFQQTNTVYQFLKSTRQRMPF